MNRLFRTQIPEEEEEESEVGKILVLSKQEADIKTLSGDLSEKLEVELYGDQEGGKTTVYFQHCPINISRAEHLKHLTPRHL